jgi:cobyrinic acid a,c-diamide synthase
MSDAPSTMTGLARLLVSAAHKSSGKTTVTLGLTAALAARGRSVQPFKKGPDYIDPMWLSRAAGRPCFNLDPHLMTGDEVDALFARASAGADLALVEGNHGLFDGLALDGSNSNAALAHRLRAPVLLVIDARGMTRGIAPLLLGYQAFDRALRIGGVVLNRVGGARHESRLRAVIEHYTDLPVLGAVHEQPALAMTERHLGLMPDAEVADAGERIGAIGAAIAAAVDLDRVLALAGGAGPGPAAHPWPDRKPPAAAPTPTGAASGPRVRIAVARDRAFGFYYPDDLVALEAAGAELHFFDTLSDTRLPTADGLFIGGGFPETCLDALAANSALRGELKRAIEAGLPTYAECGGLMLLSRSITWRGRRAPMVGAIPADAVMQPRPVGRGYVQLRETAAMPWAGGGDAPVRGHEFHHSGLADVDPGVAYAYTVERGHGIDGRHDGLLVHRLLASYTHRRSVGGDAWPARFVAQVRQVASASARAPATLQEAA